MTPEQLLAASMMTAIVVLWTLLIWGMHRTVGLPGQ